jgi:KaiC/GvpD/RAD55 family RecA-like ATPase
MQIDATTATLLASAIGAVSTGATAIIILLINKRSEERRHVRELAMKAALDNWIHMSKAATEYGAERLPLDVFVVHMLKLSEALTSCDLTADNLAAKLREVQRFTKIATSEADRFTKEIGDDKTQPIPSS